MKSKLKKPILSRSIVDILGALFESKSIAVIISSYKDYFTKNESDYKKNTKLIYGDESQIGTINLDLNEVSKCYEYNSQSVQLSEELVFQINVKQVHSKLMMSVKEYEEFPQQQQQQAQSFDRSVS